MNRPDPLVLTGAIEGQPCSFPLRRGRQQVGSAPGSEIFLQARGISRRHAQVVLQDQQVIVEDLASKNGTFVNGARIQSAEVRHGDEIHFCQIALRLESIADLDRELAIELPQPRSLADGRRTSHVDWTSRREAGPLERLRAPRGLVFGSSAAMRTLYAQLAAVAKTDLPVLLSGETGVGKEGLARTIHLSSKRQAGPFIALNCAAVPADLLEAEWFGVRRGVATGVDARRGIFERADSGSLFLDEIAELPPALQTKLLRALQEKEIHPLGGEPRAINVRLIAATNAQLVARMADGSFRSDLYYRLAGFPIRVPSLSERRDDIPILVEHFLKQACAESGKPLRGMTAEALQQLVDRPWPGNVRQLEHEIHRLACLCPPGQRLDADLLTRFPPLVAHGSEDPPSDPLQTLGDLRLDKIEHRLILEALRRHNGNRTHAARALGISRETLRRRLQPLDLDP